MSLGMAAVTVLALLSSGTVSASTVEFNAEGVAQVDGKPYFPVALFTYELNSHVMAEMPELQFNTIIHGFNIDQLDYIHQHGLKAICYTSEEWVDAAKDHPALLAWYLTDEPESHGRSPEDERRRYLDLKRTDPTHPIGICHYLFDAIEKYKDACDFTMTDVYPITANRDVPIINVGIHIDQTRVIHGQGWPNWAYIQVFGGPDTNGGKWAQPLPHEVRCMTFIALAHRATGILYFSFWPKAPRTWDSIGEINRDLHRIVPWLVADGKEVGMSSNNAGVHVRCRRHAKGGIVIAVNTTAGFVKPTFTFGSDAPSKLFEIFDGRTTKLKSNTFTDKFPPYVPKVYVWGNEPSSDLAGWK